MKAPTVGCIGRNSHSGLDHSKSQGGLWYPHLINAPQYPYRLCCDSSSVCWVSKNLRLPVKVPIWLCILLLWIVLERDYMISFHLLCNLGRFLQLISLHYFLCTFCNDEFNDSSMINIQLLQLYTYVCSQLMFYMHNKLIIQFQICVSHIYNSEKESAVVIYMQCKLHEA